MVIAEGGTGFPLAGGQSSDEVLSLFHQAHALAATAGGGLDQYRVTDGIGLLLEKFGVLVVTVIARGEGHGGLFHEGLGGALGTHGADGGSGRADEDHAGSGAGFGEFLIFGKEAVARVDGLGPGALGGIENLLGHQIGFPRCGGPQ